MTRFIIGLIACLELTCSALAAPAGPATTGAENRPVREMPASAWSDAKLADFLIDGNRPEGVLIRHLGVRQKNRPLPLYVQTGHEERRENLRRRPILEPAETAAPFSRAVRFVARVDRKHGLAVDLDLEQVVRPPSASAGIQRRPLSALYVYLRPGEDEEIVLPGQNGRFTLEIPAGRQCGEAKFQFRSGDERHEITLVFLNRKRPVTLHNRAHQQSRR